MEIGSFGDVGIGPENAVIEHGIGTDECAVADHGGTKQPGGGMDSCAGRDGIDVVVAAQNFLMRLKIIFAIPQIPPVTLIKNDAADAPALGDQFEENRDDGFDFSRREMFQESRTDRVDAGELMCADIAGGELVTNIGDAPAMMIKCNVFRGASGTQGERDEIAGAFVFLNQRRKWQVGENVAIVNEEGFVTDEVGNVGDATCGFQQHGFVSEDDGQTFVGGIRKRFGIFLRQMMCVHNKTAHSAGEQMIEGMGDQWPVQDRDEGFRQLIGQGPEPCAEPGAQNKSLVHWHDLRSHSATCKRNRGRRMYSLSMDEHERKIIAAQGYLELGMFSDVWRELHTLPAKYLCRGDVLEILVLSLMGQARWSEALELAKRLRQGAPSEAGGFIHEAYCLHELGRTSEALDILLKGPPALHEKPVFYYNAGCYRARLGDVAGAMEMLRKSFEMDSSLRRSARFDPDLETIKDKL